MGAIHNSIPTKLANEFRRRYGLTTFVESGLAQGTSALWATRFFDSVVSIEIDLQCIASFRAAHPNNKVNIIYGDSGNEMYRIALGLNQPTLFWLDGHTDYCTPILAELHAINTSQLPNVIMIDDWRMFGTCPAWPSKEIVTEAASNHGRRILVAIDDVLFATPNDKRK